MWCGHAWATFDQDRETHERHIPSPQAAPFLLSTGRASSLVGIPNKGRPNKPCMGENLQGIAGCPRLPE